MSSVQAAGPPPQVPFVGTHCCAEWPPTDAMGALEQVAPDGQPAEQSAMQKLSDMVPRRMHRLPGPHCASAMQGPQNGTVWPPPAVTWNEYTPVSVVWSQSPLGSSSSRATNR